MDVIAKYLIVPKHMKRRGKTVKRAFHESDDMTLMQELATGYAKERREDFLIVQVIREVSKPPQERSK